MHRLASPSMSAMSALVVASVTTVALVSGCVDRDLVELNPCLVRTVDESIATKGATRVDLLFVIDDSGSMEAEQRLLRTQFVRMIDLLTSGQRPNGEHFEPIADMHVGVVSTDLGASAAIPGDACTVPGKDGLLQAMASQDPELQCDSLALDRPFLSYRDGDDADALARNFQCIATLGTKGCGYEQPLEAMLKALSPAPDQVALPVPELRFFGAARELTLGHGAAANAGFLRGLDGSEDSILAVVVVTDEEDCSARDPSFFDSYGQSIARRNVLCQDADQEGKLFEVRRYVDGLRALRPNHPERVIFAAIVGLPEALESMRLATDFDDDDGRKRYYDALAAGPGPNAVEGPDGWEIQATCSGSAGGPNNDAKPAPRLVEVARGFGPQGLVHSICSEDFRPALDGVVDRIADAIPQVCLTFPLVPDVTGLVNGCEVQWQLPATPAPGELTGCDELPFLRAPVSEAKRVTADGRRVCVVDQVPVLDGQREPGRGWYYDDFSDETQASCGGSRMRRVAFTDPPGPSVQVTLSCTRKSSIGDTLGYDLRDAPRIGSACGGAGGQPEDDRCRVERGDGTVDHRMRCHPRDNVCVLPCAADRDCPAAWVCDTRATALTADTGSVCVNPTCGN